MRFSLSKKSSTILFVIVSGRVIDCKLYPTSSSLLSTLFSNKNNKFNFDIILNTILRIIKMITFVSLVVVQFFNIVFSQCPSTPGPVTIVGTNLAAQAYFQCPRVTSVTIASTLTSIGFLIL